MDDILIAIHSTYRELEFTEQDVESMCAGAKKLITLIPPETLIRNHKNCLDKM